ncbi:ABC transporter permease [Yoonia sediminilitoris]|uniref:Glycine betaine/proline transport system permease protein n=1 Tax=Yoonia sediminilitoris TaxID=1286148 RepID=A0A2T6KEY3_9RHOB|nr:ABC transporter permease subunit [Yoonia sediminilitoris]PUB13692.1 glycine betaine/proline transport system permease protein [Yoonia sediminilitoris]RCW94862.1 glycine betaine/proline transport system permease protein [Yoonia sediminilitoris]
MMRNGQPLIWGGLAAITLALYVFAAQFPFLVSFPDTWVASPTDAMNRWMNGFVDTFGPAFKAVGWLLEWPIWAAQGLLGILPWSVTTIFLVVLGYAASGWRLALFVALSLLYMAGIGFWDESMNSLAIVLISVPMALAVGFGFGVWGAYSERAKRVIMPMLDLLQTIPAFAYLLPILILFGFGTTVGLVASILYAFPPMVRNTILGLRAVPPEITEAGLISGATPSQLFWKVRLPAAQAQMLLGVNQTTMASLSMVIIASIIGGTNDIGWEVLSTIRKAQFGESLLVGFVIALIAMVLDRITYGFATKDRAQGRNRNALRLWGITAGAMIVTGLLSLLIPALHTWPDALVFDPAPQMNEALEYVVINGRETIDTIKNSAFFFIMLPIKIGLSKAVSPFTWGFALSPPIIAGYALIVAGVAAWAFVRGRATLASLIVLGSVFLFIGLTNVPWVALFTTLICASYIIAGRGLAIGTACALLFLIVAGIWPQTVLSLYLCGVGVLICFTFGTAIGIWASESRVVSAIVRPIIDTLQTMPLFVILIPFVMVFKIGEFTAVLAVIAYAIVPAIRYTEHGLRNLPPAVTEAAEAIGATRTQMLFKVKLPLALPAIMLGLNQTIIYAIGMLVIAALVGTNGLGQQIYIGLGDGDFGVGMTAGIGMAVIAMIADRMTQAISKRKQEEFGVSSDII